MNLEGLNDFRKNPKEFILTIRDLCWTNNIPVCYLENEDTISISLLDEKTSRGLLLESNGDKIPFMVDYDDAGSIGKRYRRADVVGTPFSITVDDDTINNNTVTVRFRDTMEQEVVKVSDLVDYINKKIINHLAQSDALKFKGTLGVGGNITVLPTEGVNNGDTYKVITPGIYAEKTAKLGDLFIFQHLEELKDLIMRYSQFS